MVKPMRSTDDFNNHPVRAPEAPCLISVRCDTMCQSGDMENQDGLAVPSSATSWRIA